MSSNLEKGIIGAAIIASSVGVVEAKEKNINELNKTQSIEVSSKVSENKSDKKTISFENAQKILYEKELSKKNDQEKISEIREELGLLDDKNDPEYYRNQYIKYMEHPSYKVRLAKEMYGDEIIDEEKQKNIDQEYNERIYQIKNVPIFIDEERGPHGKENSKYDREHDFVVSNKQDIFHELSHSVDWRKSNINPNEKDKGFHNKYLSMETGSENDILSEIESLELEKYKILGDYEIEYRKNYSEFIKLINEYIINNENSNDFKEKYSDIDALKKEINSEYNHISLDRFYELFNSPSEQLFFLKNYGDLMQKIQDYQEKEKVYNKRINILYSYFNYLNTNTEIKARLNYLRLKAIEKHGFDLSKNFDINNYEELKKDPQYQDLKIDLGFSDEQINELMKYTAENENINEKDETYYHPEWDYNNNQT